MEIYIGFFVLGFVVFIVLFKYKESNYYMFGDELMIKFKE